ncbi:SDR family oxidoreductase [Gynuella sp.]|uniref:SDR family oxidoreductase n=1 Tax=Gynuella sp. TaxID=2969146 RepID=UPI003D153071
MDFEDLAGFQPDRQIGAVDGVVLIPPRVEPLHGLFPEPDEYHEYMGKTYVNPLQALRMVLDVQQFPKPFKIVIVNGLSSVCALPHYGAANTMRLAWVGHSKSIALTLADQGVRINTLSLGAVRTDSYIHKLQRKAEKNQRTYEEQVDHRNRQCSEWQVLNA